MSIKIISLLSLLSLFLIACGGGQLEIFDCPELELNFGDECPIGSLDTFPTLTGIVTEDCICEDSINYDCPELKLNFGDSCVVDAPIPGTLDFNCQCDLGEINQAIGSDSGVEKVEIIVGGLPTHYLTFEIISLSTGHAVRVKSSNNVQILDSSTFGYPDALDLDAEISETAIWSTGNNFVLGTSVGNGGLFEGAGVKHLGFRVEREGVYHYSWVSLENLSGNTTLNIFRTALNYVANESILAGRL